MENGFQLSANNDSTVSANDSGSGFGDASDIAKVEAAIATLQAANLPLTAAEIARLSAIPQSRLYRQTDLRRLLRSSGIVVNENADLRERLRIAERTVKELQKERDREQNWAKRAVDRAQNKAQAAQSAQAEKHRQQSEYTEKRLRSAWEELESAKAASVELRTERDTAVAAQKTANTELKEFKKTFNELQARLVAAEKRITQLEKQNADYSAQSERAAHKLTTAEAQKERISAAMHRSEDRANLAVVRARADAERIARFKTRVEKFQTQTEDSEKKAQDAVRIARAWQEKAHESDQRRLEAENRLANLLDAGGMSEDARKESYDKGFADGVRIGGRRRGSTSALNPLLSVTAGLPAKSVLAARRQLARVLHPDLFTADPVASQMATELLKQVNELVSVGRPEK